MTNLNTLNEDWTDIGPETISALKNTLKAGDHLVGDRRDFHTAKFSRWDQDEIIATDGRILNADAIRKINGRDTQDILCDHFADAFECRSYESRNQTGRNNMAYRIPPRGTDTSLNAIQHKQQLDREFQFMEDVAESLDITVRDLIKEIQTGDVGRVIPLFMAYRDAKDFA